MLSNLSVSFIVPCFNEGLKINHTINEILSSIKDLKIKPKTIESVLPDYIWRFRRGGQFA